MPETLAALLLAHVLADFVAQTRAMAEGKARREFLPFAEHILWVAVLAGLAVVPGTPGGWLALGLLVGLHAAIDLAKTFAGKGVAAFLGDQAAHLATLGLVAVLWPGLWRDSLWQAEGAPDWLPAAMALVAGALIATRAGGFAVGLLMERWQTEVALWRWNGTFQSLEGGGALIGHLERGLIFLLVMTDQAGGIGFLIAAKSVLRFGAVKEEAKLSEYVIIGTLASFGWALLAAAGTLWLLRALPPLGIPDLSP